MTNATDQDRAARIAQMVEYIQANLATRLDLEHLASRAGMSPYHFHRTFRRFVGEPPRRFLRRLRLERAAVMLKHTSRPVSDVAFRVGYETHEAFTRAFRSRFGLAPQQFRGPSMAKLSVDLEAKIVRTAPTRIAYVRHVGPYDDGNVAFDRLRSWAAPRGLLEGVPLLTIYWDDQDITAPEHLRCEAAVPVPDHVNADGEVEVRILPGGEHAVLSHRGSYEAQVLRRTYEQAYGWVFARGRHVKMAPPFEVSDAPSLTADGGETLVHVPLRPRCVA